MTQQYDILLVEDDENLSFLIEEQLRHSGFNVWVKNKAEDGLKVFEKNKIDLCLLDIVLPDMDGISLAREIKNMKSGVPVVFLTSRNLKSDKLLGYEVGADDYITKPFDPDLLEAKLWAIIKRCYGEKEDTENILEMGDVKLDLIKRKLINGEKEAKLSKTEAGVLKVLFKKAGKGVSRDEIMKEVWGQSDFFISKSLDVYITKIRKLLKENSNLNLETIHSYGYMLS